MNVTAKWILGILAAGFPLPFLLVLTRVFRLFGDIASAGGAVSTATETALYRDLLYLGGLTVAGFLGVAMSLLHLYQHPSMRDKRLLWTALLLLTTPIALPVYFFLNVYGDDVEAKPNGRFLRLEGLDQALTILLPVLATANAVLLWVRIHWNVDDPNIESLLTAVPMISAAVVNAVFLVWYFRAYHNLRAARLNRIRMRSGWAIAGFFIPIANLCIPWMIMGELWRRSPEVAGRTDSTRQRDSLLLAVWGLLAILITLVQWLSRSLPEQAAYLVAESAWTLRLLITLALVRGITARQGGMGL